MRDDERGTAEIKVVDRRRFDATGEVRDGAPPEPERPPVARPAPRAAPEPRRKEPPKGDFLGFIAQLATQALASLGALSEAESRGIPVNPQMAREVIDILLMLDDRTQGNLSAEEAAAFKRVLADLQMHYVRQSQAPAPPGRPL